MGATRPQQGVRGTRSAAPAAHHLTASSALLQMFTKTGQASRVSVAKEILIGASLGAALGFYWQT